MQKNDQSLAQQMRTGMRTLASGVSVITALDDNGQRVAMTASSVTSVSDQPPSLLVCVNQSARLFTVLSRSKAFAVNVLANVHQDVSTACSTPEESESRFAVGHWETHAEGLPYLVDSMATFFCTTAQQVVHGTHGIYIADIQAVRVPEESQSPLVYFDGAYRALV